MQVTTEWCISKCEGSKDVEPTIECFIPHPKDGAVARSDPVWNSGGLFLSQFIFLGRKTIPRMSVLSECMGWGGSKTVHGKLPQKSWEQTNVGELNLDLACQKQL